MSLIKTNCLTGTSSALKRFVTTVVCVVFVCVCVHVHIEVAVHALYTCAYASQRASLHVVHQEP